ncbi:hypothetical protein KJ885_00575 [Patescibacteria group bacterium]|nr:hypothetical protein [Patescibacteria group bacterium]
MEKPNIEELSGKRTKILKEAVKKGEEKKRQALEEKSKKRAEIMGAALDKKPKEKVIELEAEEPKEGEGMPEELKEKLKTPENIKKNLEETEKEWEEMEDDLDWLAREEEAKTVLGIEGMEKIERLRQEAAGEIEAAEKPEPKIKEEPKVIVEQEDAAGGWSDAGGAEGGEEDLNDLFKKDEPKEVFELAKKKPSSVIPETPSVIPAEVGIQSKKEKKSEKLSLTELDDRVNALWKAMDEVLQDASIYFDVAGLSKEEKKKKEKEKKAIGKWAKKEGGVEDWPLDDVVTAENYKKRLEKYGIADLIDPSKIEPHNDAYAVISKQYKRYRDELEDRIKKVKLRQLEKLEEEEAEPIKQKNNKTKKQQEEEPEKGVGIGISELEEPKKEDAPEPEAETKEPEQESEKEESRKENEKEYKRLIKEAESIEELKKTIQKTGAIKGTLKDYDPAELLEIIDKVVAGEISENKLTSKLGLRKKVKELKKKK